MKGFKTFAKGIGGAVLRSGDGENTSSARSTTLKPMHSRHASDPVAAQARGHVLMPWTCTGSAESAVEVLLQRIGDGILAEDRQEALADLRDLISNNTQVNGTRASLPTLLFSLHLSPAYHFNAAQAKVAVGGHGLPLLCTVIKEERQDIEMLQGALECLTIVIGPPSQAESAGKVHNDTLGYSVQMHM